LPEEFDPIGIKMKLFIQYGERDNLSNVSRLLMDLDPNNNVIVLGFEFTLNYTDFLKLKSDLFVFKSNESAKKANALEKEIEYEERGLKDFLQKEIGNYFKIQKNHLNIDLIPKR
jgi:hypothetical protein